MTPHGHETASRAAVACITVGPPVMARPDLPSDGDPPAVQSRFGALHARTYEMELLVSGAVVLGLLQLPPIVRTAFTRFRTGVADGGLRLVTDAVQS